MFKDGPGDLLLLNLDDDSIESQPPEFLRHTLKTIDSDYKNLIDT